MKFTRSDAVTFALGALAAVLVPLGAALAQLDGDPVTDYGTWAMGLLTGIGAALGRYLATAVPAARAGVLAFPDPRTQWDANPDPRAPTEAAIRAASVGTSTGTESVGDILKRKSGPPAG